MGNDEVFIRSTLTAAIGAALTIVLLRVLYASSTEEISHTLATVQTMQVIVRDELALARHERADLAIQLATVQQLLESRSIPCPP